MEKRAKRRTSADRKKWAAAQKIGVKIFYSKIFCGKSGHGKIPRMTSVSRLKRIILNDKKLPQEEIFFLRQQFFARMREGTALSRINFPHRQATIPKGFYPFAPHKRRTSPPFETSQIRGVKYEATPMKQPASRRLLALPLDAAQFGGLRQSGTASKLVRGWEQAQVLQAKGSNNVYEHKTFALRNSRKRKTETFFPGSVCR